jgi:hypothetical protein
MGRRFQPWLRRYKISHFRDGIEKLFWIDYRPGRRIQEKLAENILVLKEAVLGDHSRE